MTITYDCMFATEADLASCCVSIDVTTQIRYVPSAGHHTQLKRVGLCNATCIRYYHSESLLRFECQAIGQMIDPCFWKLISSRLCMWYMNKYIILFSLLCVCVCCICMCMCVLVCICGELCILFGLHCVCNIYMSYETVLTRENKGIPM
jgi:hypothetical protein